MSEFARQPRVRVGALAALLVVMLTLGLAVAGCGSGADGNRGETSGVGAAITSGDTATQTSNLNGGEGTSSAGDSSQTNLKSDDVAATPDGSSAGAGSATADSARSDLRVLGHKAAKDCPAGVDAAQCGALVKAFAHSRNEGSEGTTIDSPRDCQQVMSQTDCETLLRAQKAAAEAAGTPVNVEECLRNPTRRCEEVLRATVEAQRGN